MQLELKYGCNPHQKPAQIAFEGGVSPLQVVNGSPGYINLLDAINAWQLVKELRAATGQPGQTGLLHDVFFRHTEIQEQARLGDENAKQVFVGEITAGGSSKSALTGSTPTSLKRFNVLHAGR